MIEFSGLLPPDAKRPRVLHGALVMRGNVSRKVGFKRTIRK